MQFNVLSAATLLFGLAAAAIEGEWVAPTKDAVRGPCPMLNTLANHGFIPRDGRGLTQQVAVTALKRALNFNATLGGFFFLQSIAAFPGATSLNLDQLNAHNVLEHDSSISRQDAYFGNNHVVDPKVFAGTKAFFTTPIITAKQIIQAKLNRHALSKANNPTYFFPAKYESAQLAEMTAPFLVFGDKTKVTMNKNWFVSFIENERLPSQWRKPAQEVTLAEARAAIGVLAATQATIGV
ncbi:hypothetical protein DSL72_008070 [Monilinia vaccinii-corymbosi]|uniref:Heme haloperoxidase family profile domain-containing protein n=1 Tax=Monilinia vaccinii-corymbosi TaxID=61207 RepID=A0A8A3PJL4_9HELO|nr:hypothetical protein DSL72_008070 [Monilinia vaccinii-corymbosi]